MQVTNKSAQTVWRWPDGTKFRVNDVLYVKVGEATGINSFTVKTMRNGTMSDTVLTVFASDVVTLVRLP